MSKVNYAADIALIASKLDGKVDFSSISFNQILMCEKGQNMNALYFIDKKFGLWFYTERDCIDNLCYPKRDRKFPTYVVCENSNHVYEIK